MRHQPGTPLRPTRRAVSAGRLCVATSSCCSFSAPRKPNAFVPNPTIATIAISTSAPAAHDATRPRSRQAAGASTTKGSTSPAEAFTPTPAASTAAAARRLRAPPASATPAASASAPASTSSTSVSLWAPPTASSSSTGFKPTNTAAAFADRPIFVAALAVRATAPRLEATATALSAHRPPAKPSEASGWEPSVNRGPYGECWKGQPMNGNTASVGASAATWV